MEKSLTITALEKGLKQYVPEIHHSDQGVQYAANDSVSRTLFPARKKSLYKIPETLDFFN